MRPDRIVVGEVRGPEALDMVQAMNTGHDGSLATCHANSALDALRRIESMILEGAPGLPLSAVREQIHSSIDLVVHTSRHTGGARRIIEVVEIAPRPAPDHERVRLLATQTGVASALTRSREVRP